MHKTFPLVEIGSKVTVDLGNVQDRLPKKLFDFLSVSPRGTVLGYKMTDGTGIGLVLQLSDGSINWFFEEELMGFESQMGYSSSQFGESKQEQITSPFVNSYSQNKRKMDLYVNPFVVKSSFFDLMNPVYFLKWLFYSLKDVY